MSVFLLALRAAADALFEAGRRPANEGVLRCLRFIAANLRTALTQEGCQAEAAAIMRTLIDRIELTPVRYKSLRAIELESAPKYGKITFAPTYVHSCLFQKHWLATFIRGGLHYFFADTKRPGLIAGPFKLPEHFVVEYEQFHQRQVLSFRLLSSHRRTLRNAR